MVGSHDPMDPLFDPIDTPDPKLLSDHEIDTAASADAELSAKLDGDLDATEYVETIGYVERARTEKKLRRSRREAEEAAALARLEEQQSNTNESDVCASTFCSSPTKKQSYSDFCDKCYLEMIEPVNPGDGYSSSESESTDTKDESGGFLSWLF
jgi:hypothetical protein